jgi:hypothetical protein
MVAQISGIRNQKEYEDFLKEHPEVHLMKVAFHTILGGCCKWWLDNRDARMNYIGLNAVVYFLGKFGVLDYSFGYDYGSFRPNSLRFNVSILHRVPFVYYLNETVTTGIGRWGEFATCFLESYQPTSIEESNLKVSEKKAIEKIKKLLEYNPINTSEYKLLNNIAWLDLLASVSCFTLDEDIALFKRSDRDFLYQNWPHYIGIDEVQKAIEVLCKHSRGKIQLISIENWNFK